jgi:hypothetical protein
MRLAITRQYLSCHCLEVDWALPNLLNNCFLHSLQFGGRLGIAQPTQQLFFAFSSVAEAFYVGALRRAPLRRVIV